MENNDTVPFIEDGDIQDLDKIFNLITGEYCIANNFTQDFVYKFVSLGYMPMGITIDNQDWLLIKHHRERCVMELRDMHISKKLLKQSKKYKISVDLAFEECLNKIVEKYKDDEWIVPSLQKLFLEIHNNPMTKMRLHSFELWNTSDELIAGEIGYAIGGNYTSLSGFHKENNSGKIQMYATANILKLLGFEWWDLGMELEYKRKFGANIISGDVFSVKYLQEANKNIEIKWGKYPVTNLFCKKNEKWKMLDSKQVFSTNFFEISSITYLVNRSKMIGDFYKFKFVNWVLAIAITKDKQFVTIRQYRVGNDKTSTEFPGGCIDNSDDTPEIAAVRELQEETGYFSEKTKLIGQVCPNPALQDNICYFVLVEEVEKISEPNLDDGEDIQTNLLSYKEIRENMRSGEIQHALVFNALQFYDYEKSGTDF